jgi:hypothetical protein
VADISRPPGSTATAGLPSLAGRDVDELTGAEFELCVAALFEAFGYRVKFTEHYDKGADLIVSRDAATIAVQVKRHEHRVGWRAVRQAASGRNYYGCDAVVVVTNSASLRQTHASSRGLAPRHGCSGDAAATPPPTSAVLPVRTPRTTSGVRYGAALVGVGLGWLCALGVVAAGLLLVGLPTVWGTIGV